MERRGCGSVTDFRLNSDVLQPTLVDEIHHPNTHEFEGVQ
jgi:hypothetical protein